MTEPVCETLMAQALAAASSALFIVDRRGVVVYQNVACVALLGRQEPERIACDIGAVLEPFAGAIDLAEIRDCVANARTFHCDFIRRDESRATFRVKLTPFRGHLSC